MYTLGPPADGTLVNATVMATIADNSTAAVIGRRLLTTSDGGYIGHCHRTTTIDKTTATVIALRLLM